MNTWQTGDLVMAKVVGWPWWPGVVSNPSEELRRIPQPPGYLSVFFFGTNDFAWIDSSKLAPYQEPSPKPVKRKRGHLHSSSGERKGQINKLHEAHEALLRFKLAGEGGPVTHTLTDSHLKNKTAPTQRGRDRPGAPEMATVDLTLSTPHPLSSLASRQHQPDDEIVSVSPNIETVPHNRASSSKRLRPSSRLMSTELGRERRPPSELSETVDLTQSPPHPFSSRFTEPGVEIVSASSNVEKHPASTGNLVPSSRLTITELDMDRCRPSEVATSVALTHNPPHPLASFMLSRQNQPGVEIVSESSNIHTTAPNRYSSAQSFRPSSRLVDTQPQNRQMVGRMTSREEPSRRRTKFGFLGLDGVGAGVAKNLLLAGFELNVWDHDFDNAQKYVLLGACAAHQTPRGVAECSDVILSCTTYPDSLSTVWGDAGILEAMAGGKAYVEMSEVDPETSLKHHEAVIAKGGRYLEAMLQGEEGTKPKVLAAGDASLYQELTSCVQAFADSSLFLGDVGNATKSNLLVNQLKGTMMVNLCETMVLAERMKVDLGSFYEVMKMNSVGDFLAAKAKNIADCTHPPTRSVNQAFHSLSQALAEADKCEQGLPCTSHARELYKRAKHRSYGEHDISSLYYITKYD